MSSEAPKTTKKKGPQAYEIRVDESGAIQRVAVAPTTTRTAITTPAVQAPAPAPAVVAEDLEELVFDEEGEEVTGEAREKILAEQKQAEAPKEEPRKPEPKPIKLDEGSDVDKMKLFYLLRAKNPRFFGYTAEGNLEVKANNPEKLPPITIPLRAFSELKPEEYEEVRVQQEEKKTQLEEQYVLKMRELRDAYQNMNRQDPQSATNIVKINQELRDLSILRNKTLFPERWIRIEENPDVKKILLNKPYEDRKMGYDAFLFKRWDLPRKDAEGHYREHGELQGILQEGGATVVLFITDPNDQKTGLFHPASEREFVYNETKYVSPYQAYETERFKELDEPTMVKQMLGTRSARTIQQLARQDKRSPQNPSQLWENILKALFTQHHDLGEALKATGSARFHMMDKQLGTPEYANALVTVRTHLKEREEGAPESADIVKQGVITEEEQQKAKVGAIVNQYRNRG